MAKTKKTLWIVLLFFLFMAAIPSFSDEGPIINLFLKSGTVMQCDQVWEGVGSNILCQKSRSILAYSANEVDLVKTFGEADGKEIAARYERIIKGRELSSKPIIVTPEQERAMRKRKRARTEIDKPTRLTRKELEELYKDRPTTAQMKAAGTYGGGFSRGEVAGMKMANYLLDRSREEHSKALEKDFRTSVERMKQVGPATSSVIESKVDGDFEGWDGDTIVKLINGQIWHQTDSHISVTIKITPDVLVYRSGGQWKMKVEGTREAVYVERLR